jgi:hypothetical protein
MSPVYIPDRLKLPYYYANKATTTEFTGAMPAFKQVEKYGMIAGEDHFTSSTAALYQ